jgi:hypothetical protein
VSGPGIALALLVLVSVTVYFIPWLVAKAQRSRHSAAILALKRIVASLFDELIKDPEKLIPNSSWKSFSATDPIDLERFLDCGVVAEAGIVQNHCLCSSDLVRLHVFNSKASGKTPSRDNRMAPNYQNAKR